MRWCVTCVVLLLASGCPRWTGVAQARQKALRQGLMDQRMPEGFRFELAPTAAGLDCRVGADLVEHCRAGVQNVWFAVNDGPEGGQFEVPTNATEQQIVSFWKTLDISNFRKFEPQLAALVHDELEREDAEFAPQWGLTAAFTSGVSPTTGGSPELGAKAGIRRWFSINWGGFLALDYTVRLTANEHRFALRVGAELTRFTPGRLWGRVGAPPVSISAFMGPRLALFPNGRVAPGMRTGVGFLLTDWKMAPLVLEFCADTYFTGDTSRVEFFLQVGFGL